MIPKSIFDLPYLSLCGSNVGPIASSWAARVVINGGATPSMNSIKAVDRGAKSIISAGLASKMIAWNMLAPDSLIACRTPQLVGPGSDPWTNFATPFAGGDLTVNGLVGDGSSKGLFTGIFPNTAFSSVNDCGITIYAFTNPNSTNCDVGSADAFGAMTLQMYLGTTYFDAYNGVAGQGRISASNSGFTGYVSGNRTASNAFAIYEANSGVAHNALVTGATSGGALPAAETSVFALNSAGTPGSLSNQRLSFAGFHHGFLSTESAAFYPILQQLRTDLGGGFI